jgi:AraC-like DNA-binding protein
LAGESYFVEEGCLVFRKPGQLTIGKGDYNMYLMTLDFSHADSDASKLFRGVGGIRQRVFDFGELDMIPPVFKPRHYEELKRLFERLSRCSYPGVVDREQQKEYIRELLLLVLYEAQSHNRKTRFRSDSQNNAARQAHNYIWEHFREPIRIQDVASMLYLNENHLIRIFKKQYQITPNQYLLETRLVHARYLLLYSDQSVKEIALSCGFHTTSYFIKKFCHRFQKTPSVFRRENQAVQK